MSDDTTIPNAPCRLERRSDGGYSWVVTRCPYCSREHAHGGGRRGEKNPDDLLGHRVEHCDRPPPGARGYFLVKGG